MTPDRALVTRHIEAPAHAIFRVLSDPVRHVEIDGSGMLRAAPGATPLTAVGQTFDIEMDRRPLGSVPNTKALHQLVVTVPDYLVRCTVTRLIPDRLIEWAVRAAGKPPAGHVWGWEIKPLTDSECLVSHYCDWTNVSDELRAKFRWPVVPADRLEHSVENVNRLVTSNQG